MLYWAIFNVNRNCWLEEFDSDQNKVVYRNRPVLFCKEPGELAKFVKNVANATGDEFSVQRLEAADLTYKPSLVSSMSAYTKVFAPKVAEVIHNTAIRFGNSHEEKLKIAKELSESLDKAMSESVEEMIRIVT